MYVSTRPSLWPNPGRAIYAWLDVYDATRSYVIPVSDEYRYVLAPGRDSREAYREFMEGVKDWLNRLLRGWDYKNRFTYTLMARAGDVPSSDFIALVRDNATGIVFVVEFLTSLVIRHVSEDRAEFVIILGGINVEKCGAKCMDKYHKYNTEDFW